jgi:alcohol dehydrogenase/L-iditol 2-dehydrogenase
MEMMKAVVKVKNVAKATCLMDMPIPNISDDEVLIEVKYCGICGTDPHMHHNRSGIPLNLPLIFGHEFAGIIVRLGKNVKGFSINERVTCETHQDYCNECILCRTNQYHLCNQRKGYGFQAHGAFCKYVSAKPRILHKLPDNVSLKEAALTEPLCVAYKAVVSNSCVNPGDVVVVIGPGPIGLLCAKMASLQGASEIIVIGTKGDEERIEVAKDFNATYATIDSNYASAYLDKCSKGIGADLVVDTAGVSQTLDLSLDLVKKTGQITKIGWGPKPVGFSLDRLLSKNITLKGHFSHTYDVWEKCIVLMKNGQVDLKKLITHELPLEKWEEGFSLVENKEAMKVILKP